MKKARERNHRLLKENYIGCVRISFTLCINERLKFFREDNENIINYFLKILKNECEKQNVINWIYVFMPDHVHMILEGRSESSDLRRVVNMFKQKTGYYLKRNFGEAVEWQKDYYDYIHREKDKLKWQMKYIAENPIRKEIVKQWNEYKYTGSIHQDVGQMINNLD